MPAAQPVSPWPAENESLAVLVSGGLDSAILLAQAISVLPVVYPLYICTGMFWEEVELAHLRRYIAALGRPAPQPLVVLDLPVRDLYGEHWSLSGRDVPGAETPDEAVYLPGRNVLLLSKALLWCHLNNVPEVALGSLGSNPFPDATPEFFTAFAHLVSKAVDGNVRVRRPYLELHKIDVMRFGRGLPLECTFSCIRPVDGRHCGRCNKCAERQRAFREAGMEDPTTYALEGPCSA